MAATIEGNNNYAQEQDNENNYYYSSTTNNPQLTIGEQPTHAEETNLLLHSFQNQETF